MVSLEIALALPLLLAVVLVGAWVLHVGQTQARLTDAARAAAREAARGAGDAASVSAGQQVLPSARISVATVGAEVVVRAETSVGGPGPWLGALNKDLHSEVATLAETP